MSRHLATWTGSPRELLVDNHGTGHLTMPQSKFPGCLCVSGPMTKRVMDNLVAAREAGQKVQVTLALVEGPRVGDVVYLPGKDKLGVYLGRMGISWVVQVGLGESAWEFWHPWMPEVVGHLENQEDM